MQRTLIGGLAATLLGATLSAGAQAPAAADTAASTPVSERTRRDAERPLLWIRQHGDLGRAPEPRRVAAPARGAASFGQLLQAAPPAAGRAVAAESAEALPEPVPAPLPALAPDAAAVPLPTLNRPAAHLPPPPLQAVESPEPELGATLLRRVRRGTVQVRVKVDRDGAVQEVQLLGSSHPALAQPVLDAARRWRFQPPGQPAEAVLDFRIDPDG